MTAFADLLAVRPTIGAGGWTADLKVQTDDVRVHLARTGLADGEPFERTVYVELLRGAPTYVSSRWCDLGRFDGDLPMPDVVARLLEGVEL